MKEHPIIFSSKMVRAILQGRKTQTRRVIKPQPPDQFSFSCTPHEGDEMHGESFQLKRPYGKAGDTLWVRERWCQVAGKKETKNPYVYYADILNGDYKWQPSNHMPRVASRITLAITSIKAERLQEISVRDLWAEGLEFGTAAKNQGYLQWKKLWNSINAKRGFGWDKNPWVWVITFKLI